MRTLTWLQPLSAFTDSTALVAQQATTYIRTWTSKLRYAYSVIMVVNSRRCRGASPHRGDLHLGRGLLRDLAHEVEGPVLAVQGDVVPRAHVLACVHDLARVEQVSFSTNIVQGGCGASLTCQGSCRRDALAAAPHVGPMIHARGCIASHVARQSPVAAAPERVPQAAHPFAG